MSTPYDATGQHDVADGVTDTAGPAGADLEGDRDVRRPAPTSSFHLVFGLVFLGLAAFWALSAGDVIEPDAGWAVPLVLLLAGLGGLVPTAVRALSRR